MIYRIRSSTTTGLYFSIWVFGWGSIQKIPQKGDFLTKKWGSIQEKAQKQDFWKGVRLYSRVGLYSSGYGIFCCTYENWWIMLAIQILLKNSNCIHECMYIIREKKKKIHFWKNKNIYLMCQYHIVIIWFTRDPLRHYFGDLNGHMYKKDRCITMEMMICFEKKFWIYMDSGNKYTLTV